MYQRLIATSGTSAIGGGNVGMVWLKQQTELVRVEGMPPRPVPVTSAEEAVSALLQRWTTASPPVADPTRVSAEYSVLHALRQHRRIAASPDVVMIHSDTFDGRLAARMAGHLIERDFGARVQYRTTADLDARRPAELRRSLGAFMHEVGRALREGEPGSTCFSPIGGYKVMTALGYVAGAFLRYPTLYLHEGSQGALHEIPWVPIRIDEAELKGLAPLIRRAMAGVMSSALTEREREQARAYPWLFEQADIDGDTQVLLNAFGHFLREEPRYRGLIGAQVRGGSSLTAACARADSRAFCAGEIDGLLQALGDPIRNRATLHHEADFGHRDTAWSLYKGASGSAGVFRALYRWDSGADTLDVKEVWLDHDAYERQAPQRSRFDGEVPLDDLTERLYPAV